MLAIFFLFLLAGNPCFNDVVLWRCHGRIPLQQGKTNVDSMIKSSCGRCNRFAYVTVVNVGKLYLLI